MVSITSAWPYLALMHSDPASAWGVAKLALEVHMSRSVLADRFTQLVNIPPMHYLKRWRLAMAARLLCNELSNLAKIAETIGYESEAAFKREYGIAPGLWRRGAVPSKGAALKTCCRVSPRHRPT